ncbi:putative codeine 3-O-demethylase [Rosa chinensis]|uniref:Putative codeine 3-O-demethylase n=1 Tax=Rosa chinensis TaxID=74649 RepID=A0A2P6R9X0_ROSCH|nr:2-oxoglutarate-dependent dioxygenase 11 [Rosa chinensis]PRQ43228.1 putative codeine 3-O-demethylase [Rosa chinensis]
MGSNSALYDPCPPLPNVQEMVKSDPFQVPERYIRDEKDIANDAGLCSQLSSEVPIVDFSLLSNGNKEELHKLDQACEEWGFFQMVNHGVATEITKGLKDSALKFFELPLEEKNKIAMPPNDIQGYGHSHVDQVLDWSDKLVLVVYPQQHRKLDVWPPNPFKEAIETYSSELRRIGEELLRSVSLIMGMEKDALLLLHQELVQPMSVAYYPPCFMSDKVMGLSPHSDKGTLGVLMQEEDVPGLQIKHEEKWVPIKSLPNAFVVNVGDIIEIWSNGKYKSIEHRVVTNKSKARISYSTFYIPHRNVDIEPLNQMVLESPGSLPLYKKVTYGDYLKQTQKMKKEGKAHVTEVAKIAN